MSWTRFLRRGRSVDEAAREIASYIAIETDENIARGMSPHAAHEAAVRKFGNPMRVREEIYWMNTVRPLDALWQDLKFGARLLWRDKGFALAAIVSLALGIGANTAIFQLLDTVRLRSLPIVEPDRLVTVSWARGALRAGRFSSRWPDFTFNQFEQLRARQQIFASLFAWTSGQVNTEAGGEVRYAEVLLGSGDMFSTLRVKPIVGRLLGPDDEQRGCGAPAAVISSAYWQRVFSGSPSVLSQTVRLKGMQFPVVGVTEPAFFGLDVGRRFDIALPLCADPLLQNGTDRSALNREWWLAVMGRLQPGRALDEADQQLRAFSAAFTQATIPDGYSPEDRQQFLASKLAAVPAGTGVSDVRDEFGEPLIVLLAGTALVLLIACANLANLLLARGTAREREIAVRLSIGASRARVVSQLIIESLLLALLGTLLAVLVAGALSGVLVSQLAIGMGSLFLDLDWNLEVFGFTTGVALLACVLFGLAPALKATALTPASALRAGGRGLTAGRERFGLRRALVVAQVALSLVLLIGALFFARTLYNLWTIDAGFDQEVAYVNLTHRSLAPADPDRARAQRVELQEKLSAIPGVAGVAITDNMMLSGSSWNEFVLTDANSPRALSNFMRASPNFFLLVGMPILQGRGFGAADVAQAPAVAVVNEMFVKTILNGADPIGHRFWVEPAPGLAAEKIEIVGVTRDTKYQGLKEKLEPLVVLPITQSTDFRATAQFVLKANGIAVDALMPGIQHSVAQINPSIDVSLRVIKTSVRNRMFRERLLASLASAFGALAALLAAVGIYGVMSYTVARRANEIGIRLAMGASRRTVLGMVIREAVWLLAAGLAIGTALGLGAAQAASTLLFGLEPTDSATIASAIALLASIGLLASYLPARRASRVDPMSVLRQE